MEFIERTELGIWLKMPEPVEKPAKKRSKKLIATRWNEAGDELLPDFHLRLVDAD